MPGRTAVRPSQGVERLAPSSTSSSPGGSGLDRSGSPRRTDIEPPDANVPAQVCAHMPRSSAQRETEAPRSRPGSQTHSPTAIAGHQAPRSLLPASNSRRPDTVSPRLLRASASFGFGRGAPITPTPSRAHVMHDDGFPSHDPIGDLRRGVGLTDSHEVRRGRDEKACGEGSVRA